VGPAAELPLAPAAVQAADPGADPTPLFRLMREIHGAARSGHLHFTHGREFRSLRFVRGLILHGTSDVEGEHLGNILVRYGLLTQPDLERAREIVLRERRRLGPVLDELGILDKDRLEDAVSLHAREILFNVAGRTDGSFAFEELGEGTMGAEGMTAQIAPGQLILEAARRVQSPAAILQVLGDLDRTLVLSRNPVLRVQRMTLSPAEGFVLSRIDGALTAREVCQIIPLPSEETERSLFALLCTGTLEYLPRTATSRARAAAEAAPRPDARAVAAPPPASPTAGSHAGRDLHKEREEAQRAVEDRRRLILDAFDAVKTRDYFEFLGVEREAGEKQIKEAYFRMARPFHPDSPLDASLADLRDKREAVFLHLGQVYETLRNPSNRARYERFLEARSPRKPTPSPAPPATPPSPASAAPPDRAQIHEGAAESVRNAVRLLKEEKYWDAIQLLEGALPQTEGPVRLKARVTLARAYMKNPKWLKRSEETLQAVIQESPEYAEAYLVLGLLYRASEMRSRAVTMVRKALELQPDNEEARAELAALGGGEEPEPPPRGFKKFFGRS
jgi:tetratricopeptide (TPR) repeat protein